MRTADPGRERAVFDTDSGRMIPGALSRRRFLAISAAFAAAGPANGATRWRGLAFGADASITLRGPEVEAKAALAAVQKEIERAEELFSLYRPTSWISGLNRDGSAVMQNDVAALLALCDHAYTLTGGLFDPTVQVLWAAAARRDNLEAARGLVDWKSVSIGSEIRLGDRQALTLNGIAQGWATDRVAEVLTVHGFRDALVNIGEFRADAGDWRIGLFDPKEGLVRQITLSGGAVATSSPQADLISGSPHIFGPMGEAPIWSTVSVEAETAALADALSTALCLAPRSLCKEISGLDGVTSISLIASNGDLEVLR